MDDQQSSGSLAPEGRTLIVGFDEATRARTPLKRTATMAHKGFSHIGLSTLDLDRTRGLLRERPEVQAVRCDTLKVKEGGQIRHIFLRHRARQLIAFMERGGAPRAGAVRRRDQHGLGYRTRSITSRSRRAPKAGLDEMRNALIARGVE